MPRLKYFKYYVMRPMIAKYMVAKYIVPLLLCLFVYQNVSAQEIVATVGKEKITLDALKRHYDGLPPDLRQQKSFEELRPQLINQAVVQKLFVLEARRLGFNKNKEVKEALLRAEDTILHQFFIRNFAEKSRNDAELKKEYDEFKQNYASGTEYQARHILVKTEKEAKDLIKKLDKGTDFVELAKTYSTGPSASRGGDLGYFREGAMVKPFENAVKLLDSGKYSQTPVKTNFGWHVIKLEGKRQAEAPPLAQVKQQLERQMTDAKLQAHLKTLEEKYKVEIHQ